MSPQNPGEGLIIRPLALGDFHNGYMELLKQLTKVGDVTLEMFQGNANRYVYVMGHLKTSVNKLPFYRNLSLKYVFR